MSGLGGGYLGMRRAHAKIVRDVAALEDMSLADLRVEWERRYGAAPRHRSLELFRRVPAWRIRANVHGGFEAVTPLSGVIPLDWNEQRKMFGMRDEACVGKVGHVRTR